MIVMIILKLLPLFCLAWTQAEGFGILKKYKEYIDSIGVSFGRKDLQCLKHLNAISKDTIRDNLGMALDMFSTDKGELKESLKQLYYNNGSCYYLSSHQQYKSYAASSKFCLDIGTNNFSSLYEFKNREDYDVLVNKTQTIFNNLRDSEKYIQFYIGLKKNQDDFLWPSGRGLTAYEEPIVFFNNTKKEYDYDVCYALTIDSRVDNLEMKALSCGQPGRFICKFVLDYCEGHNMCGNNGYCKSVVKEGKFICDCHIFYHGEFCDAWSYQGIQIVICFGLIFSVIASMCLKRLVKNLLEFWSEKTEEAQEVASRRHSYLVLKSKLKSYKVETFDYGLFDSFFRFVKKKPKVFILMVSSLILTLTLIVVVPLLQDRMEDLLENPYESRFRYLLYKSYKNVCNMKKNFLIENYMFIVVSLPLTVFLYFWNSFQLTKNFKVNKSRRKTPASTKVKEDKLSSESDSMGSVEIEQKSQTKTVNTNQRLRCDFNFKLLVPMNPFSKTNRFITCVIYAAYIHNISKIFESSFSDSFDYLTSITVIGINQTNETGSFQSVLSNLYKFQSLSAYGILIDLLLRILNVFIIGFHFYPVLLCVEFTRKSKLSYLLCSIYMWLLFVYYVFVNELCQRDEMDMKQIVRDFYSTAKDYLTGLEFAQSLNFTSISLSINSLKNKTQIYKLSDKLRNISGTTLAASNLVQRSKDTLKLEEIIFYIILCMIAVSLSVEYVLIMLNQVLKLDRFNLFGLFNSQKINLVNKGIEYESDDEYETTRVKNELNYTIHIFKQNENTRVSYLKSKFEQYIYKKNAYFRFSKQFLNIHIISFILLYYVTFFIIRRSEVISYVFTYSFAVILNLAFKRFLTDENIMKITAEISYQVSDTIIKTCVLTTAIYVIQLVFGIKKYQGNVLKAYKGVYKDIPEPKKYSNPALTSGSLHYSGYAIGFLIIGYAILLCVNFFLVIIFKILSNFPLLKLDILKYVLPLLTIFIFKRLIIWYLCRFVLTYRSGKTMRIKNMRLYLIVNHFNFFFDSFIIFFIALMRVFYSLLATLFFMPRLDYSIFGLFLQRFDMGFMSYISFIHMEVNQKHPIKVAFCELVKRYANSESYQSMSPEQKAIRNRWNLAYTLYKNPVLKRERKSYVKEERFYRAGKNETAKQFLKRKFTWRRKMNIENEPIELKYIRNNVRNDDIYGECNKDFNFVVPARSFKENLDSVSASEKPRKSVVQFKSEIDVCPDVYESQLSNDKDRPSHQEQSVDQTVALYQGQPLYEEPWTSPIKRLTANI